MITVLIAVGAGLGGILVGAGWVIWRVSRRYTLRARPVEPVQLPAHAQAGDMLIEVRSKSKYMGGAGDEPRVFTPISRWMPATMDSFDVAPPIPYPYPVSAEHPPTDIDD